MLGEEEFWGMWEGSGPIERLEGSGTGGCVGAQEGVWDGATIDALRTGWYTCQGALGVGSGACSKKYFFCPPKSALEGRPGRWIWPRDPQNLEFAPSNPRSKAPWALDLWLVPKIFFCSPNPRSRALWALDLPACDPPIFFCPPKSALEGALDVGSGGVTPKLFLCPPKSALEGALGVGSGGATPKLLTLPPQIRARGRPGRWIWGVTPKMFFLRPQKKSRETGKYRYGYGPVHCNMNLIVCQDAQVFVVDVFAVDVWKHRDGGRAINGDVQAMAREIVSDAPERRRIKPDFFIALGRLGRSFSMEKAYA